MISVLIDSQLNDSLRLSRGRSGNQRHSYITKSLRIGTLKETYPVALD